MRWAHRAPPISDFEFRIFVFQSAFRNLQSAIVVARPTQKAMRASWFLPAPPLPWSRQRLEFDSSYASLWREIEEARFLGIGKEMAKW
jgi:hypothetical protein